ncbi:DUF4214 domain-containing protein [Pseudomonas sp. CDFA 602]|uniref:DUF4214 domain-containing protein n=1 Tax=Pseudomonas californiensis TaxID=2829823 RepID=UPI001E5D4568|nr:DUF4214 domain-containing protein [Pseudomonas californiensis]MCD5993812.1 DUF4214 domain-containing protein [Pseudomonas californiensis]MCD5999407.1 DUF4214 domain-containing protein [Pseudomonas californiensis]
MSDNDLKRFDIVSGEIQRVYESDDGRWELEHIDADETYTLSGSDVVHTERDDGLLETTVYRDLDGSGTFREISSSYSSPDQTDSPVPVASDASLARLYMAVFDRAPDQEGFRYWEQQLDRGMEFDDVAESFIKSPEFSQTYSTLDNAAFIDRVYLNVLDRNADAAGKNLWVGQLENDIQDREDVVIGFSESAEFVALSADSVDAFLQLVGQPPAVAENTF